MQKLLFFVLVAALMTAALPATLAQGPGEGGPIIEANSAGSANIGSFNPLRCSGTDCARIASFLFPGLVGVNPETADFASVEDYPSTALALRWEVSEDGLEYTFYLRQDATWTDGTPITAQDIKFSFDAIASGQIESSLSGYVDAQVTGVEVIDDYTVKFTYAEASCDALSLAGAVSPLPRHVFNEDISQIAGDFDRNPSVSSGPFQFGRFDVSNGQIVLLANQNVAGLGEGGVIPEGFIYVDTPDDTVAVEGFIAGESNFIDSPLRQRREELKANPDIQTFEFPANGWNYVGLNLADPANPQNRFDEEGNEIEQGSHPIFSDVAVRRALQHGINVPEMIETVSLGQGIQMAANEIPSSWALNPDLAPIAYDPAAAAAILDEAGWVLAEGEEVRAKDGVTLEFGLLVPEGSPNAERIALLIQDRLSEINVRVNLQILDFNTIVGEITGQTFDAVLLAWSNGYPVNPDISQIFYGEADIVGAGFNFGSYYNPEMEALNAQARTLPGCDPAARAELYGQVQAILQADQPYLWLYSATDMYAASASVNGFGPFANQPFWNVETWKIDRP
jgi:ABC-type transport system substrate-binding protein